MSLNNLNYDKVFENCFYIQNTDIHKSAISLREHAKQSLTIIGRNSNYVLICKNFIKD